MVIGGNDSPVKSGWQAAKEVLPDWGEPYEPWDGTPMIRLPAGRR